MSLSTVLNKKITSSVCVLIVMEITISMVKSVEHKRFITSGPNLQTIAMPVNQFASNMTILYWSKVLTGHVCF